MSELEVITKQFIDDYANAEKKGEINGIKLAISIGKKYGATREAIISDLVNNLKISLEDSKRYVEKYWDLACFSIKN